MREHEHYDFEYEQEDNARQEKAANYANYDEPYEYSNEMARSAVERFLESEASEDAPVSRRPKSKSRRYKEPAQAETYATSAPQSDNDEEYMTRLADARKERQRRRDQNPVPKPAVRVNVDRPRRSHPAVVQEPVSLVSEEEWAPMAEEDFNNFRERYNEPHIMAPREPKAARTRSAKARDTEAPPEGRNPMFYMIGILAIGALMLIVFLAVNNRSLRLDLERHQAQATDVSEYAAEATRLGLELDEYRETNAALQASLDEKEAMLAEFTSGSDPYYYPDGTQRPTDGAGYDPAPPEPPAPEPVIHIVESGQVLSRIARMYFGSSDPRYQDMIVAANDNLSNRDAIYVGQRLIIPVQN